MSSAKAVEVATLEELRRVAQRLLGLRVRLDDDAVGARRDGGAGERRHELAAAGGMRRVDDHRQVGLAP